jgi:predicted Zn-dependent protease with MMP-like domain
MPPARWKDLEAEARRVVEQVQMELPKEIRVEALKVPVLLQSENEDDPDLLGLYDQFTLNELGEARGPILLYLDAIALYCEEEGGTFAEEVRLTYLHELGHHFGWDEDDLEGRGLG